MNYTRLFNIGDIVTLNNGEKYSCVHSKRAAVLRQIVDESSDMATERIILNRPNNSSIVPQIKSIVNSMGEEVNIESLRLEYEKQVTKHISDSSSLDSTTVLSDSDRRKELIRILKPWRRVEDLAIMTDDELFKSWQLLCDGDEPNEK